MQAISIAMSIFTILGTILLGMSVLPQVFMTLKTKQTAKLSLRLYLLLGIGTFLLLIYGIGLAVIPQSGSGLGFLDWLWSYRIPGIAIIVCEVICSTSSFFILGFKLSNKKKAKQLNLTEEEYEVKKLANQIKE